jgi:hypothetical protein
VGKFGEQLWPRSLSAINHTARIWDATTGAHRVTLLGLADGGYAVLLPDGSYKLSGNAGDAL